MHPPSACHRLVSLALLIASAGCRGRDYCPGVPPRDALVARLPAEEVARVRSLPEAVIVEGRRVGAEARFIRDQMPVVGGPCISTDRAFAGVRVVVRGADTSWRPPVRVDSAVIVAEDSAWASRAITPIPWGADTLRLSSRVGIGYFEPSQRESSIIVAVRIILPDGSHLWLRSEPVLGMHVA